jgi:GT2 family glycosyltransferase
VGDFLKLLESPLDIISGLYQTSPNGTVAVNRSDSLGRPTKLNKTDFMLDDEPVEVGGVGFGFVAMKAEVFEKTPRPWFLIDRVRWDDMDFDTNVGEDYSFCNNAKRAGYKIWVDPLVRVLHHKETVYQV